MTSFKLTLHEMIKGGSSRKKAREIRETILSVLTRVDILEIDLQQVNFTPSVADEIIGLLAIHLGAESFKRRIKIKNANDTQLTLMKHVIARRLATK